MKLCESMFLSTLLFNAQTWNRLRKPDINQLKQTQLKFLKSIMPCPYSMPNAGTYLELRILSIEYIIEYIIYMKHLASNKPSS